MGVRVRRDDFEWLFVEYYQSVYRYVHRRVERDVVEDLVAESFAVAWRRHDEIVGDPLPWLLGVARRVCANHLRSRRRRAALALRLRAIAVGAEQSELATGESALRAALDRLSIRDRELLMLIAWDGLSNAQAARVVGCSPSTFAVRLHRARNRLARALAALEGNETGEIVGPGGVQPDAG
jgi:RNA polymerase sigma-70 factor (ECF subfamily)